MLKKAILWISAFLLASLATLSAIGAVTKNKAPELAAAVQPANGFAFENLASAALLAEISQNAGLFPDRVDSQTLGLAKRAFFAEPLTPEAVAVLALDNSNSDNRILMSKAFTLTRRSQLITGWMIVDAGVREDIPAILNYYDANLRVSRSARSVILPIMAQGLANERFIDPLGSLLARDPPWANQFWNQVAFQKKSISNAAKLRVIQIRENPDRKELNDQLLIKNLVIFGFFGVASELFEELSGEIIAGAAIPLDSLKQPQKYAPFDWDLVSKGNYAATIDTKVGSIDVAAIGGSSGVLARRLVKLTKNAVALSLNIQQSGTNQGKLPINIKLSCAAPQHAEFSITINFEKGVNQVNLPLETSSCEYYWFEIYGRFPNGSTDYNLSITDIHLV